MVDSSTNLDWQHTPKSTGRGIVIHDGKILLIERWRPDLHYFSIPGGGIEAGERPDQTAVREIFEESTLIVQTEELVIIMNDGNFSHSIYLCHYISGEPELTDDAPEAQFDPKDNRFKPGWVPIADLQKLPFTYWEPIKQSLIDGLKNDFADGPVTVTIND